MPQLESQGVTIAVSDMASTPTFADIAFVEGFDGPQGAANEIPVTHLTSTRIEILMGLPDEGPIVLDIFYDPDQATHQTLRTLRDSRTANDFRITLTDETPTTWTFSAYVMSFSFRVRTDDAIRATVTLRITDEITIA